MHNTPKANAEFQLTWCETNLRELKAAPNQNDPETAQRVAFMKREIQQLKATLKNS